MATRSQVREVVAQLLYAYGSGNDGISKFMDEILEEKKIKNAQNIFAKELFDGVIAHLEELDLCIRHQIKNWDFERIGDMERAILRLGAYEILFSAMDKAIVINEALEIAKHFGNEASTKFINGILDGIAKNAKMELVAIQEILQKAQEEKEAKNTELQNSKNVSGQDTKQNTKKTRDFKFENSKKHKDSKNNKDFRVSKDSKKRVKAQNPKGKREE